MTTKPYPIRIATDHLGADAGIGTVSPNNCVTLNLDVPVIREAIESNNSGALAILVAGLLATYHSDGHDEKVYARTCAKVYARTFAAVASALDRPHLSVVPPSGGDAA